MNASNVIGQSVFTTGVGATSQAGMNTPRSVYFDYSNQRLYVADELNNRVTIYTPGVWANGANAIDMMGQYNSASSTASVNYTADGMNNLPHERSIGNAAGIATDEINHRLFVADAANNRILVFNLTSGNLLVDHTADYVIGQSDFKSKTSSASQSKFGNISIGMGGLAFDNTNNRLFVADTDNNRVLVFDTATVSNGMNATRVLGQTNFTNSGAATTLKWSP
jgi:DNA-binding beta-propeller fold protein YncE